MKRNIIIMAVVIFIFPAVFVFSSKYMFNKAAAGKQEWDDKSKVVNQNRRASNDITGNSEKKSCCTEEGQSEFSDKSVYLDESVWKNQFGKTIQLGKFKNKNVVMTMFFASCQSACPMIINSMKKIEAAVPSEKLDEYQFILVTIDPARDNPQVLLKYAKDKNLNPAGWTLLTGKKNDVVELAMILGFKFSKTPDGGFTHSNQITFLNKNGEIVHQSTGLSIDINSISGLIASLN